MMIVKLMGKILKASLTYYVILSALIAGYVFYCLHATAKPIKPSIDYGYTKPIVTSAHITWPDEGESAVGILGSTILDTHNTQTPLPTASTAKMITALMVLKAKPLSPGSQGPDVPITQNDVNLYDSYVAEQGSVVPVEAGEQISEYQMLEAMLLPSANNIADSLASWAYGSLASYSRAANTFLQQQGLGGTHVGSDASGFDPSTVSTASDLVRIGEMVENNTLLASIVSQTSASDIPVVGSVHNVDALLGKNDIVGIKTGNNDQDKGAFVGAARENLNGKQVTVVTAFMGANSLPDALGKSQSFLQSSQSNFQKVSLVPKNTLIATYHVGWNGSTVEARTADSLNGYIWGGKTVMASSPVTSSAYPGTASGTVVGTLSDNSIADMAPNTARIVLDNNIGKPSAIWKLTHPLSLKF